MIGLALLKPVHLFVEKIIAWRSLFYSIIYLDLTESNS